MFTYMDKTFCSKYKTCKLNCPRKLTQTDIKTIADNNYMVSIADLDKTEYCLKNKEKDENNY